MSDELVLGIDLGTTFSAVAIVDRFGKPTMVPNAEGHPTTPSVVHFYDRDACVVGDEAVKMVVVDPTNVVRFIKRSMGEPDFTLEFFGRSYTPQELSAIILKKLHDDAEAALGNEVHDAVITVPAYFNSAQRAATAESGQIAGLNVLSIINEPTTAAIAYGLGRLGGHRKVLVFDLGGGTFDVTLMEISGISFRTIASDGNAELGGKDWDDRLVNFVAERFIEKFNLDPRDDPQPYQELYERCLYAKISLSTKPRAVIPVNFRGHRMVVNISREEFEAATADLVQQCTDTCSLVFEKAALGWGDLDEVLLVGGSTRMPMIKEAMRRVSGREEAAGVNPDECVALGAALAGVFRHRPKHPALQAQRASLGAAARTSPGTNPGRPAPSLPLIVRSASMAPDSMDAPSISGLAATPPERRKKPGGGPTPGAQGSSPGGAPHYDSRTTLPGRPGEGGLGPSDSVPPVRRSASAAAEGAAGGPGGGLDADSPPVSALPNVLITDVTTHPLGIVALDRNMNERVVNLIPAPTPVPCEKRGRFAYAYDNMTAVRVEVTEGHGSSRDEVKVIGEVLLENLPPRPRGTPIDVIYRYTVNQILEVDVMDVETAKVRRARMDLKGGLSRERLDEARRKVAAANVR